MDINTWLQGVFAFSELGIVSFYCMVLGCLLLLLSFFITLPFSPFAAFIFVPIKAITLGLRGSKK